MSTKKLTGKVDEPIMVLSNDPANPKVKLNLRCSIAGVKILPTVRVYFNAVMVGTSSTEELTIATIGESPLTIYTRPSDPNFVVKLEKLTYEVKPASHLEYWKQYKLIITIPQNFPEGRFSESVTLITDSQYDPSIKIFVAGEVYPTVVVSPSSVRMKTDKKGEIPPYNVKVTKKFGEGLKITKILTNSEHLIAEIEETKKEKQYRLKLTWSNLESKGGHRGVVILHTNDEQKPVISIPVYVKVE